MRLLTERSAVGSHVEEGGRELVLVAEIGDGHAIDQMPPEDGDLLGRRVVLFRLKQNRTKIAMVSRRPTTVFGGWSRPLNSKLQTFQSASPQVAKAELTPR